MSELKRYIPGNIWAFLGRVEAFSKKEISKKHIAQLLIFEAEFLVFGSMVFSLFGLPFIFYQLLPGFMNKNSIMYGVIITVTFVTILFLLIGQRNLKFPAKYIFPSFGFSQNLFLFFNSQVFLFFFGLGTYFTVLSLQPLNAQSALSLIGFFVFSFFVGYISLLTPMGLGIREAMMTAGLARFMALSTAGFAAIFARIILIVSELLFLLIVFVWYKTNLKLKII